jgi:hypothetical protein
MHKMILWCLAVFSTTWLYGQEGKSIYKTYCAGCHGGKLEGASASKLIKKDWLYGKGRAAIHKNIKYGIPKTEMIGWGKVLKEKELKAVVDFIVAAQGKKPLPKTLIPRLITTKDYVLKIEKLVSAGLQTPWGIEFVDKSTALITEKGGTMRWLINGKLDPQPITGLPKTHTQSATGGYMDLALDPKYAANGWVYLSYSHTNGAILDKAAAGMTKIIRGRIKGHRWTDEQTLFEVPDSLMVDREIVGDAGFYLIKRAFFISRLVIWVKPWLHRM